MRNEFVCIDVWKWYDHFCREYELRQMLDTEYMDLSVTVDNTKCFIFRNGGKIKPT